MNEPSNQRKKPGSKPKVNRGHTGSDLPPAMQTQGIVSGSREEKAHSSGRPSRISMGNMKKLDVPDSLKEDGYYYRWFQNKEGRLSQAQAAYYEPVVDEQGNAHVRQSGPYSMHLMKLPQKYRDEDNALKKKRVLATLEAETSIGEHEYAPNGGNSAIKQSISDNPMG